MSKVVANIRTHTIEGQIDADTEPDIFSDLMSNLEKNIVRIWNKHSKDMTQKSPSF